MKVTDVIPVIALLLPGLSAAAGLTPDTGLLEGARQPQALPSLVQPALTIDELRGVPDDAAAAEGANPTTVLHRIVFRGVDGLQSLMPHEELARITARYTGRPVTFGELQEMTVEVTRALRQQQLLVARAYLAPQALVNGVLTVSIMPGRYDEPRIARAHVNPDASASQGGATPSEPVPRLAERMTAALVKPGKTIERAELERLSMLLNAVPGQSARITLAPGAQSGLSRPLIELDPERRYSGYVSLDNQGLALVGRGRVLAGGAANGLIAEGDTLHLDVIDSVQASAAVNGLIDYSLPVGARGLRLGGNAGYMGYSFAQGGYVYSGEGIVGSLYATYPWVRRQGAAVDVMALTGTMETTDRYPDPLVELTGGEDRKKRDSYVDLSLRGSVLTFAQGLTGFGLTAEWGTMDYRNATTSYVTSDDIVHSSGGYTRLSYQLSHEQSFAPRWSVYGNVAGQYADQNLDGMKRMQLGGPYAVRAYDTGTGAVSQGTVANIELRWRPTPGLLEAWGGRHALTLAAFYDAAWGQQLTHNTTPSGGPIVALNNVQLSGAGLYARIERAQDYALTLTWARRLGAVDPVSGLGADDQLWCLATKYF